MCLHIIITLTVDAIYPLNSGWLKTRVTRGIKNCQIKVLTYSSNNNKTVDLFSMIQSLKRKSNFKAV